VQKASIDLDGHNFLIEVEQCSERELKFHIVANNESSNTTAIALSGLFRSSVDNERLSLIVKTLLSHDFLLKKKVMKGHGLEFRILFSKSDSMFAFQTLVSLHQETALASRPQEKVLPWLLPKADTQRLYPFQKLGIKWLLEEPNRLLADDMGLGKTVQTIFAIRHGFSELLFRNVLILCPKSLVTNWQAELQNWAPEIISLALAPPAHSAKIIWRKAFKNAHVLIANYEQGREAKVFAGGLQFDLIVADEAHRLRNASSQVAQGFKAFERHRFWALTGTPIERDLKDLATLMSLMDFRRFTVSDGKNSSAALREKAKPYILRRTKAAVLKDLPEVVTRIEMLELHEAQMKTYRSLLSGQDFLGEKIINPLHKLGQLRRVCDFDPVSGTSIKLDRILEELIKIQVMGEKAIVFSYSLEPLRALHEIALNRVHSAFISGKLDGAERSTVISKFKNDPQVTVLFASSKVASEGLTLVEANHVFFINRWWNPSSNAQARDRVNRIGQTRTVFIHEYVCKGTVEEKIQDLLVQKGHIYKNVVGKMEDLLLEPAIVAHLQDSHKTI